jgi:3-oxoacyl-[acyl-carrier protein] reductase
VSIEPTARVALVTGGSRGIGRGIVLELAHRGYKIAINYRSNSVAAESARAQAIELGAPEAIIFEADVSTLSEGRRLVDETLARFGRFDLFVNNAGIAPEIRSDLLDASPESFDRVMNTNLRGPFFLAQSVAQAMLNQLGRAPAEPRPKVVFVTSVSSTFASPNRGDYCVSKAGLSMTARLFAVRLAEHGIGVFEVRPGIIETDMTGPVREVYDRRIADGLTPIRRWGTAEDVGKVVGLIADGQLGFSTGEVFHVDGGLNLPRL